MAGLLDFLSSNQGGGGGGLLDYLRSLQPQGLALSPDMQPANFDQNQGYYTQDRNPQPSPLDNARWPAGPIGAPSGANAQVPIPQNPPSVISAQSSPQQSVGSLPSLSQLSQGQGPISGFFNTAANALMNIPRGGQAGPNPQQTANLTAHALVGKGVDPQIAMAAVQPGNTDLLKQLVNQAFGPQTVQSLGSGYIYNPKTAKVERAYEPDDKVPVGFEKTDKGLQPIAGGPADPAYLRLKETAGTDPNAVKVLGKGGELYRIGPDGQPVIVHKNQDGTDATLSDDATRAMAAQYLSGDKSVLQNLGRGAQGAANIVKLREEITKQSHDAGLSAKDILTTFNEQAGNLAGQRTVGTRAANISLAANEANNMIPIALDASAKVPRGDWMPWNKAVQAYQRGTSSPELASFVAATNSLVNAYVRAVSPSGVPTDSMREHAYSMLNSAQGPEAYAAVISTMRKEMQSALEAPAQVRKELRGENNAQESKSKVTVIDGYKIMEH